MTEQKKPLSLEVLGKEEYENYQKDLNKIFRESQKRGEVWLYPFNPSGKDFMTIWIRGKSWGRFLFEALSNRYQKQLKSEGEEIAETNEDMLLPDEILTLSKIKKKAPAFIKKYYPQIQNLPIRFFSNKLELINYRTNQRESKTKKS